MVNSREQSYIVASDEVEYVRLAIERLILRSSLCLARYDECQPCHWRLSADFLLNPCRTFNIILGKQN